MWFGRIYIFNLKLINGWTEYDSRIYTAKLGARGGTLFVLVQSRYNSIPLQTHWFLCNLPPFLYINKIWSICMAYLSWLLHFCIFYESFRSSFKNQIINQKVLISTNTLNKPFFKNLRKYWSYNQLTTKQAFLISSSAYSYILLFSNIFISPHFFRKKKVNQKLFFHFLRSILNW